jgi:hypothetical protein
MPQGQLPFLTVEPLIRQCSTLKSPNHTFTLMFNSYAPQEICTAIYGDVPGARFVPALGQWTVPCDAEIDMALQFG